MRCPNCGRFLKNESGYVYQHYYECTALRYTALQRKIYNEEELSKDELTKLKEMNQFFSQIK